MSKQLYEEALADMKRLKEVAEDNAKRSIIEAVAPRIRDLIEKELLHEGDEPDEVTGAPGSIDKPGELMTDEDDVTAAAISSPDEEGKVTLDLDALSGDTLDDLPATSEYELGFDSVNALRPILSASPTGNVAQLDAAIDAVEEQLKLFKQASTIVKETLEYSTQVSRLIARVKDMYGYVRESISDAKVAAGYEVRLEGHYEELKELQEQKMLNKNRKKMHEGDVSLKLTGLPDDIDLDSIGVDLITGAGEEEESDVDLGGDEESESGDEGEGSEDLDLDLDLGDEEEDEEEEASDKKPSGTQQESQQLDDDDVVEIDESMLRREISRMRRLREQQEEMDQARGCGDQDDDLDESDDDEMDQAQDSRSMGGNVAPASMGRGAETNKRGRNIPENIHRQIKIVESAIRTARRDRDASRVARLRRVSNQLGRRLVESVNARKALISESTNRGARSNSVSRRPAEQTADKNLRQKLTESNLFNVKLVCTNKLLQNESLSKRQKAEIIERLDEAKSIREVHLVYESLTKTLQGTRSTMNESRVRGSASMATRPSATLMTEGATSEVDRWQQLAGIHK